MFGAGEGGGGSLSPWYAPTHLRNRCNHNDTDGN